MIQHADSDNQFDFSDDEKKVTFQEAKRFKLQFGQHSGKRLLVLVKNSKGRDYLRYLLNWDKLRENTRANIQCVLDEYQLQKDSKLSK
jgi:hypothetical protein